GAEPRRDSAPVHRESSDAHRTRLQRSFYLIAPDMVVGPRVFVVVQKPLPQRSPAIEGRHVVAGLDHDDRSHALARKLVRDHRGADPRADDANVALDDVSSAQIRHTRTPAMGNGLRGDAASGRHWSRPIFAWYARSAASELV